MEDPGTDSLRKLAPSWTLAGDEQLLTILQNTHQRLLSKCQEANSQLEQMTNVLNDASISLQNVNNQFMALSNRQFIESRVYDDDELPSEAPPAKEAPRPDASDELTNLKRSIAVLESTHEIITILQDSDTESDTDDEMPARMVMKPKDLYSDRPLPYIIGSQPWKNKWHAGLLVEDSDSDSSGSRAEADSEQYSHSEPEDTPDKLHVPHTQTTVSETSSELPSEQGSVPKPTPSDVASEIARRLGAREPPKMVERKPEYEEPAKPTVRKIYRPQDPVSSTIFPDEPPPLSEQWEQSERSEQSDSSSGAQSDIFAELHREPYARSHAPDELFGFKDRDSDDGDIFSDFAKKPVSNPSAKPSSLFDAGPTPHMFDKHNSDSRHRRDDHGRDDHATSAYDKPDDGGRVGREEADRVKKPVGGISLFGNKGTESIGAAILKRNQRKSSSSGDESESDSRSESQPNQQIKKQKDIFDDLFARSEGKKVTKETIDIVKDIKTEIKKKNEEKDKKIEKAKVDLFSDNLFDDIDDIFSTNVVKMPTKDNAKAKSIFEDDDDLFSDIAATKPVKIEVASSNNNKKSLFDSDDELFSEDLPQSKPEEKPIATTKPVIVDKPKVADRSKTSEPPKISKDITRSIFDDDDDEDDIFSDVKTNRQSEVTKLQNNTSVVVEKPNDFSKGVKNNNVVPSSSSSVFKSPSLFDDDDDESDLFAEPSKSSNLQNVTAPKSKDIEKRPYKSEIKIPDEILDDEIPPDSFKTDDFDQVVKDKNDNLNKDNKPIQSNVNTIISATESIKSSENSNPILPVSENLDSKNAAQISEHIQRNIQNVEESSSDTNNDFSDQDFDDLQPKETIKNSVNSNVTIETKRNDIPTNTEKDNIFDKPPLEDDIFAQREQKIDNKESIFKNIEPDFKETLLKDSKKTEKDNKTEKAAKNIEADIFSDILTEPPEFEKPKEPKKSKNVNALFDDDSDDESLFFKKNDPIFEENPEDFTPTQDRLFGLFTDEPPDDDFTKISDDLDDDMFCTVPKPKIPPNENLPPIPNEHLEENLPVNLSNILEVKNVDAVEDIFSDTPKSNEKPVFEIPKENSLDKQKDSSIDTNKLPNTVHVEQVKSPAVLSDDEQLFKVPTSAKTKPSLDIVSDDEDLFASVSKSDKPSSFTKPKEENPVLENSTESVRSSDEELFASKKGIPPVSKNTVEQEENLKSDEDLFKMPKSKTELMPKSDEIPTELKSEPKKVGKLKVGLNINVNALLPGASPKKAKPNDQTDGQTQSLTEHQKPDTKVKVHPDIPKIPESQNTDSKLIKSVSFDGKPESDVLDNKLSKERAKIQVKRRPSTRRARREAVRKSGIDFGEDSTDNSSSIDDPPRRQPDISKKADKPTEENINQDVETESTEKSKVNATRQAEIQPKTVERQVIQPENVEKQAEIDKPYTRDVKSKVVYILNDEDIFNTSPTDKPDKDLATETSKKSENLDSNTGVSTLGKVYDNAIIKNDNSTTKDVKSSLFGDENDEEIFKAKTGVKKTSIFDSDSEEELFGTNKKERNKVVEKVEVRKEIKREVVKGSLFGDDEDDDDLFGVKTKKVVEQKQKPQPSKPTARETPKPTEPVFEDPLSMFGDDD